ncbi:MAG: hypothetical protein GY765_01145, partial [bacterium]|nr:hypothetical protein [bacterium]
MLDKKVRCQKCHGTMAVGDGAVPKFRCNTCHADVEKIKHYSDSELMHQQHITDHKIECSQCHTTIQHKSVSGTQSVKPDCRACHPDFHDAQLALFSGENGKGIPNHPDPMFTAGLNCQACHIFHTTVEKFEGKGHTVIATPQSCEPCHGKGYDRLLETWKTQSKGKVNQLEKALKVAESIVENNKTRDGYKTARLKLDDALHNYKLVKHGNPIHNMVFSEKLMEKAYMIAKESLKAVKSNRTLPSFQMDSAIVPGKCSNCHIGIARNVTEAFGWRFPHYIHLENQKLDCAHCHSNEKIHGELIISKKQCMDCHHDQNKIKDLETACKKCHSTQHNIYFSNIPFSTLKTPNVMGPDTACLDCHNG